MDFEDFLMTILFSCLKGDEECPTLWVFGYGSLMWKPGFEFKSSQIGYIDNYERRFNQGNETFRGKPGKPGRVANLEKKQESKAWGVAFEICGKEEVDSVLRNLYEREIASGGYDVMLTTFHPRCSANAQRDRSPLQELDQNQSKCIQALVFTATHKNDLYLGSKPVMAMARQIVEAEGTAGNNVEYVLRISMFIKKYIPEDNDLFLFELDKKIREVLAIHEPEL